MAAVAALALWACGADAPDPGVEVLQFRAEKSTVGDAESAVGEDIAAIRARAESGDREAQFLLGYSLRTAEIVSDSAADEGLEWIQKSADQGWADAQAFLGDYFRHGECRESDLGNFFWGLFGCEPGLIRPDDTIDLAKSDNKRALHWLTAAADQGHSRAQWKLGEMYWYGYGVTADHSLAVNLYRRAADQGDSGGRLALALAMEDGKGVEKDIDQALALIELAARDGYVEAQDILGGRYKRGEGVTADIKKAIYWLQLAGEQGSIFALWELGSIYRNGDGVAKDYNEAMKWYRLAANRKSSAAENMLGVMYDNGEGVSEDDTEAVKWYRLAADRGSVTAQYNLALRYDSGTGVPENDTEAVKWFRLAAEQGNANAQESLGEMYASGEGVAESHADAYFWLSLAAASGSKDAIEPRERTRAYLKPAKTLEVQARASAWVAAEDFGEAQRRAGISQQLPKSAAVVDSARVAPTVAQPSAQMPGGTPAGSPVITTMKRDTDVAVVTAGARLRASPDGEILASIAVGAELALLARDANNGWYEVIDVESGALGWIHESVVRLELASSPAPAAKIFQAQATGVDAPPEVKVENKANRTIWLRVGDQKYTIAPGQTLEVDVPAGSHRFNAWAAGVIPASGTETFNRGYTYNWAFWIKRR